MVEVSPIRVLVVDDHEIQRGGIRFVLLAFDDIELAGEARSGEEALEMCGLVRPDVILMDMVMPGMGGVEAVRRVREQFPEVQVLALTTFHDRKLIQKAMDAGAIGFLLKGVSKNQLAESIRAAKVGRATLSSEAIEALVHRSGQADGISDHLIRTKLRRPNAPADTLYRPRLHDQLNAQPARPLVLVSAPAGYGKTTLLSSWLEGNGSPSGWVSLEESESSLPAFLACFLAAVRSLFPNTCGETAEMLEDTPPTPVPLLARTLSKELDSISQDFILVLDNYHHIRDTEVHSFLAELLRHFPTPLHLILSTRLDPPLPIARLRARDELLEIRMGDLRFTMSETDAFLRAVMGHELDPSSVAVLHDKTEGWPTGLRLAALSTSQTGSLKQISSRLQESNRYVMDYLVAEVLEGEPRAVQIALLKTSVLDRFCASLCDAVCNGEDYSGTQPIMGRQYLNWLRREDLFLVPQDDEGTWYCFHGLFRQLLQHRLKKVMSPEEIALLHSRASRWFIHNNMIEEALEHAILAGDTTAASLIVEKCRHELAGREDWKSIEKLLGYFPAEAIESEPELLLAKAWLMYVNSQQGEIPAILDRTESLLVLKSTDETRAGWLRGEIDALRSGQYCNMFDGEEAVKLGLQSLQTTPPDWSFERGTAAGCIARGYQLWSDSPTAKAFMTGLLLDTKASVNPGFYTRLLKANLLLMWISADAQSMIHEATHMMAFSAEHDLGLSLGEAHYLLGIAAYQLNLLSQAESHLSAAADDRYATPGLGPIDAAFGLALTYRAQGRPDKARETSEMVLDYLLQRRDRLLLPVARAFQAELMLMQGNLDMADQWAAEFEPNQFTSIRYSYLPHFTLVKVLLARDTGASRQQAADLLNNLREIMQRAHNRRFLIDTLALQALLLDAEGDEKSAFACLEQALHIARPGGLIRVLLDLGPRMANLAQRMSQRLDGESVHWLWQAFSESTPVVFLGGQKELIEPLTDRELEVLWLFAQRLSNKEIADRLCISHGTVKSHAVRIFGKLDVSGRREAVEKAASLGVLSRWP